MTQTATTQTPTTPTPTTPTPTTPTPRAPHAQDQAIARPNRRDPSGLSYQILGPMLITGIPAAHLIPGGKPRQLLATLLLHPNRFVSSDYIADNLWDGRPPDSAAANLRTYVRIVRAKIGERDTDTMIETRPGGYALVVNPDAIDTTRAESLIYEARHLAKANEVEAAVALYDEATDLWRGTPLEDVPVCSAWQPQLSRWENTYTELLDEAIKLHVDHGDPRQAAKLVRDVLDRDPYNEGLWCLLMQCLLSAGQSAAAVAAAREGAALLDEELGVEVGAEFAALAEEARTVPAPTVRFPSHPSAAPSVVDSVADGQRSKIIPTQLPMDTAGFMGRADQLEELTEALRQRSTERPLVAVVFGPPGIGKTSLAVRLAHETRGAFPDGQIFLNLRGTSTIVDPAFAVNEALSALGLQSIPTQIDRAAALLRSELATRRVLLVVDDVGSVGQVAALIPGTGDSALLVTSRRRLTDMMGARFFELDVLDENSAIAMAAEIAPDRSSDDLKALVHACGLHPLAIRITAARLSRRPDLAVATLVGRLTDPDHALNELTLGELAFRTSADQTCRSLDSVDARGFRVLGALDVGDFPGWAVELASGSTQTAEVLLEENLLQFGTGPVATQDYRMHDLLRWRAREWGADDADEVINGVREVLFGWLVRARAARDDLPYYLGNTIAIPETAPVAPTLSVSGSDYFAAELGRLRGLLSTALRHGSVDIAWRLACTWSTYFDLRGHTETWLKMLQLVLPSTNGVDDPVGEATVLRDIGQILQYRDDATTALDRFGESLAIWTELGDDNGAGIGEVGLGAAHRMLNQPDRAMPHFLRGQALFRKVGNQHGEAHALNALASIHMIKNEFSEAKPLLDAARSMSDAIGDHHRVAQVLRRMGSFHSAQGDLASAQSALGQALEIFHQIGDQRCARLSGQSLGRMLMAADDLPGARRAFTEALSTAEQAGDAGARAETSESLAALSLRAGRAEEARRHLRRSARAWQIASRPADAERVQLQLDRLV